MNHEQASAILARRGLPCISIVRVPTRQVVVVYCAHCGANAELPRSDDVEARVRDHWQVVCPVTAPFHGSPGWSPDAEATA